MFIIQLLTQITLETLLFYELGNIFLCFVYQETVDFLFVFYYLVTVQFNVFKCIIIQTLKLNAG